MSSQRQPSPTVVARPAITLAFFGLGFAFLATAVLVVTVKPALLLDGYYTPGLLALTHAVVLGWLGSMFAGAAYQLGPVIAGSSLRWSWLGWIHLALHGCGVPLMVAGFTGGRYDLVLTGGILVTAGFAAFIATQVLTASVRWRGDAVGCGLVMAWFWLAVVLGIGLQMTWLRHTGQGPSPSPWLRVHALLGAIGFFLTVFNAVSFRLIPMFAVTAIRSQARVWTNLLLTQAGLQLLGPAALLPFASLKYLAAGLIVTGQLFFLIEIVAQLRGRHRKLDGMLRWFSGSLLWLAPVLTGLFLVIVHPHLPIPGIDAGMGAVAVFAGLFIGLLTTAILAMSFKIVPFLVWQACYARFLGRYRTPSLADFVDRTRFTIAWLGCTAGSTGLMAALAVQSPLVLQGVLVLYLVGLSAAGVNSLVLLRHIRAPRLEPLVPVTR